MCEGAVQVFVYTSHKQRKAAEFFSSSKSVSHFAIDCHSLRWTLARTLCSTNGGINKPHHSSIVRNATRSYGRQIYGAGTRLRSVIPPTV